MDFPPTKEADSGECTEASEKPAVDGGKAINGDYIHVFSCQFVSIVQGILTKIIADPVW